MVTLSEIAVQSGFSVPVVSRALSLNPNPKAPKVAAETRRKICETAKRLGYTPNRTAEFLKKGKNPTIGVFLQLRSDSLLAELIRGISTAAMEYQFPLALFFDADYNSYLNFLQNSQKENYCGIITYPVIYFREHLPEQTHKKLLLDAIKAYLADGGRLVMLENNNLHQEIIPDVLYIDVDHAWGGRLAADYLLKHGAEIVFTLDYTYIPHRSAGFIKQIRKYNLTPEVFPLGETAELSHAVLRFHKKNPSKRIGIYASTDKQAIEIFSLLAKEGLTAGTDYLLIGYDNQYATQLTIPGITTIAQPMFEVGYTAVRQLINAIYRLPVDSIYLKPKLIVRGT